MIIEYIKRIFKRQRTSQTNAQDVPFPRLLKTGDASFDEHCARAWEGECYAELATWYLRRIKDIDDLQPSPAELEMLRRCRRNQILCDTLSRAISLGDLAQDLQVNFYGADVAEKSCPYCREPLTFPIRDYLANPDALPCRECVSEGRKYFCMTIINSK